MRYVPRIFHSYPKNSNLAEARTLLGDVADGQNAKKIAQDLTSQQVLFYVQSYEPIKKMVHDNYSKGITSSLNGRSAQK